MSGGHGAELSRRRRTLSLAAVIASSFGIGISYGVGYPLVSLTFEQWGVPVWLTGLVGSMQALAIILLLPFFPALVARLGTVPAMTLGCMALGLGFVLMHLLPGVGAWLALRFVMGAGVALPWLVGETWINTLAPEGARTRVIALYAVAVFSGFAAGPLLLEAAGVAGWAPFLVGAGGAVLAAVPILAARHLAPALPRRPHTGVAGALRLAPAAMAGAAIGGFLEMSQFSLLTNYVLAGGPQPDEALGLLSLLTVGGITLQFAIGWLGDQVRRGRLLVALALAFAAGVLALPATLGQGWVGIAVVFLIGGMLVGFYTLALAMIGEQVGYDDLAVANAAFLIMYQAGAMVGPTVTGAAMAAWPPHGFIAATAGAALVGAAVAWRLAERRVRPRAAARPRPGCARAAG